MIFTEINLFSSIKGTLREYFCGNCWRFQFFFVILHTQREYKAEYEN